MALAIASYAGPSTEALEGCTLRLKINRDLDSPWSDRLEMINKGLVGLVGLGARWDA